LTYFSDRENGPKPQVNDAISDGLWGGLASLIQGKIDDHSLGHGFPEMCSDGHGPCGCDEWKLGLRLKGEIPSLDWPLNFEKIPSVENIMDLLEFCAMHVGLPVKGGYHDFMRHYHLSWDQLAGLEAFVGEVNRLFLRNGVAYELSEIGQARRLISKTLAHSFNAFHPYSGDSETDRLIQRAKELYLSPRLPDRRDALEKLYDAFERIKTLEEGKDKKHQAMAILAKATPNQPKFHEMLSIEAIALTNIGNQFRIRHSETSQELLQHTHDVDYLFSRLFAFIEKLFSATGRTNSPTPPPLLNKWG